MWSHSLYIIHNNICVLAYDVVYIYAITLIVSALQSHIHGISNEYVTSCVAYMINLICYIAAAYIENPCDLASFT